MEVSNMKNTKRLLAVVLTLAMLVPMCMFGVSADNTADNWNTLSAKYDAVNGAIITDVAGFTYTDNADGGIDIVVPEGNGAYPVAAVTSKETTPLDHLTVTVQPSEDFVFSVDKNNASASISMLWTKTAVKALADGETGLYTADIMYKDGLRSLASANDTGLAITVNNGYYGYNFTPYAGNLGITLFNGDGFFDTVDKAPGYEWEFAGRNLENEDGTINYDYPNDKSEIEKDFITITVKDGVTFYIRTDVEVGYVVNVNGTEYYKGSEIAFFPNDTGELENGDYTGDTPDYTGSMTYAKEAIDLSDLEGVNGYLTVGITGNFDNSADLTVETINGIPAAQWNGEAMGDRRHDFELKEEVLNTCTEDGYAYYECSECDAHYSKLYFHPDHHWITYDRTPNTCTEDGQDRNRCIVCGELEDKVTKATDHKWSEFEVTKRATSSADGKMTRICQNEGCGAIDEKTYKFSDADVIADNWFVHAENRWNYFNGEYEDGIVFTTINEDGSITLKDTMAQYPDGKSWNNITKITSTHQSHLHNFTATVEMLPANDTSDLRPDSVSFIWFNQYDTYRFAGQYSGGTYFWFHVNEDINKRSGAPWGTTKEDSRLGYMYDNYTTGAYTYNITLNDDCLLWNQYQYGQPDDNEYDFILYTSVCRGDLWDSKIVNLENKGAPIDATKPITVGAFYEYSEDDSANVLAFTLNDTTGDEEVDEDGNELDDGIVGAVQFHYAEGLASSQTFDQIYYFGVAAYADEKNLCGASFTLTDVCGEKPVDFDGYYAPSYCPENEEGTHVFGEFEWELSAGEPKYPTCSNKGRMIKVCKCGASEYMDVAKIDHSFEPYEVIKEPTCVEEGLAEAFCVACTLREEEIVLKPTGVHAWTDWVVTKEATATEHGEGERYCLTCFEKETVIHVWEDENGVYTKYPTCGENGNIVKHCVVCGEDVNETVAATGVHYWGEWTETKKPDCGYEGAELAYCMMCDAYMGRYLPKVGEHLYDKGKQTVRPTCTTTGVTTYTCTICARVKEEKIPANGHTVNTAKPETTTEATCASNGSHVYTCKTCRKEITEVLPGGHIPVDETAVVIDKEATCTETGSKSFHCSRCDQDVSVSIAMIAHKFGAWETVKAPNCTERGLAERFCTACGFKDKEKALDPEHLWGETIRISELTCSTSQIDVKVCQLCGEEEKHVTEFASHDGGEWTVIKESTCTEIGEKTVTCLDCGETFYYYAPATGHIWGEWEVTVEPTVDTEGERVRSCTACEETETEVLAKLPNDEPIEYPNPFTDVKPGQWYTEAILWCNYNNYMNGVSETVFGYKQNVTRSMFVTILAKIDGADLASYEGKSSFTDVKTGQWYSNAIEWAFQNEFTSGLGEGIFGYKADVTREQLATFFYTYSEKKGYDVDGRADLSAYEDLDRVHGWALEAVKWAVDAGLISGTSTTTLAPRASATRSEIAVIVKNYVETFVK